MKKSTKLLVLSLSLATAAFADPVSVKDSLTEAIYLEEVSRDPEAAAARYTAIVNTFLVDGDSPDGREYFATALFRLAEIHNRQGREKEAKKLYQSYLDRFPDLEPQAGLARGKLGIAGSAPGHRLTEMQDTDEKDTDLSENVSRMRWNISTQLKPDELLLTVFEVKHQKGFANEGLPPAFIVRALHHAPSGKITNGISHTTVNWTAEHRRIEQAEWIKNGIHVALGGGDRWNHISAFGQSFEVPEGLTWSGEGGGEGSGDAASLAFFFSDEHFIRQKGKDYEKVKATKRLTVKVSTERISLDDAHKVLLPLKMDLPEMGDDAWSLTLPPSPAELEARNK